jgi:uncharacterized protein YwgA
VADLVDREITAEDVVVLLAAGATGRYSFDPIRLMKACFLVSQRGRSRWRNLFNFRPYDYGPFDPGVYRARDNLITDGLLTVVRDGRYDSYELTNAGMERAQALEATIGDESARWLKTVGRAVTEQSFSSLIDKIYAAYPDYAKRSVLSRK